MSGGHPHQWRGNCCIFHDLRVQSDEIGCNRAAVSASLCLEDQFRDGCDNIEAREFVRNYAAPAFEAALSPDGLITLTPSFQKIKKIHKDGIIYYAATARVRIFERRNADQWITLTISTLPKPQ
jgi:hypothetical protein